jgi:hypothetical protein
MINVHVRYVNILLVQGHMQMFDFGLSVIVNPTPWASEFKYFIILIHLKKLTDPIILIMNKSTIDYKL